MEVPMQRLTQYAGKVTIALAVTIVLSIAGRAQTYTILHSFSGGSEGSGPVASLTLDQGGNLYGVAQLGGSHCGSSGCGTVFQLFRHGSSWIVKKVYDFTGGDDGAFPDSRVLFGLNGSLYGTTSFA